jgi:phenylacetate-CoA ligase
MGTGNTELQAQVLRDMRVTGWVGIASFLMTVLKKGEEMGYDIRRDLSLRVAMPHAEPGGAAMRKLYEEKYGIASSDIYPTADVGVISYECRHKQGMHIAEEMLVEIVDPSGKQLGPGEPGEVVVTPLENTTYPLVRFGTGDLSSYVDELCDCGRTSLKLSRILGRVGEAIKARGMFIHPKEIAEVAARIPGVGKYQVVISRRGFNDELDFKVELGDTQANKENIEADIKKTFQDICRLRVDRVSCHLVGSIPKDAKVIVDERTY